MKFKPLDLRQDVIQRRRNLPHWQQDGCAYFVTFRLADSIPQSVLGPWRQERDQWMALHKPPWNERIRKDFRERFTERMEQWLDAGHGACLLRQARASALIAETLRYFDKQRYVLDVFVIMPNHVHVLVVPGAGHPLESILHTWKSYSAKAVNRAIGSTGTVWMDEYFDHAVRSEEQLDSFRRYIQENPGKARLPEVEFVLGTGSGIRA